MFVLGVKKGTILASFVCVAWMSVRFPGMKLRPSPALVLCVNVTVLRTQIQD